MPVDFAAPHFSLAQLLGFLPIHALKIRALPQDPEVAASNLRSRRGASHFRHRPRLRNLQDRHRQFSTCFFANAIDHARILVQRESPQVDS